MSTKSPVTAALPPPVGWKLIEVATPIGPAGDHHLLFLDGLATGHSKLIHPAILLTFHPDDLVKLPDIELHRRRSSGRRRLQRSFAFGQRSAKGGRQLDWITVSANVHIEGRRLGSKQVVVYRGYFDAAFDQFVITGLISVSSNTRSPITMASLPMGLKATHPPSANPGLTVTPSSATVRSLRGKPYR